MNEDRRAQRIAFVSCVKTKAPGAKPAREIFSASTLFRLSFAYAESLKPDRILLLTTEYGLVTPTTLIENYDRSPNLMGRHEWRLWGRTVRTALMQFADPDRDHFIFVTGSKYADALTPYLRYSFS